MGLGGLDATCSAYSLIQTEVQKTRTKMTMAVGDQQYIAEVKAGQFPDDEHSYAVNDAEYDKFAALVAKRKHV